MTEIYSIPGWIVVAILYFFPTEWGMGKNTVRGARWWEHRKILSFLISSLIYLIVGLSLFLISTGMEKWNINFT